MRLALRLPVLPARKQLRKPPPRIHSGLERARRTVMWFFAMFILANVVLSIGMDTVAPRLRDADYISRRNCLQRRIAIQPQTVVLGSSRTDHGIRPLVLENQSVTNASQIGAGPLLELLTFRRLLNDGLVPRSLIVEYWPPFLHGCGAYSEWIRIDPHRYFPSDEPFIRDYHPDPEGLLRLMREIRRTPVWNHRQRLLSQILPSWLPPDKRLDGGFAKLDSAGWMPGLERVTSEARVRSETNAGKYYQPLLAQFSIDPTAKKALREILSLCRERRIPVTLLWMPESGMFRSWYTQQADELANSFLHTLHQEYDAKVIMARDWMHDSAFTDGYHLTAGGAAEFTRKLLP